MMEQSGLELNSTGMWFVPNTLPDVLPERITVRQWNEDWWPVVEENIVNAPGHLMYGQLHRWHVVYKDKKYLVTVWKSPGSKSYVETVVI